MILSKLREDGALLIITWPPVECDACHQMTAFPVWLDQELRCPTCDKIMTAMLG